LLGYRVRNDGNRLVGKAAKMIKVQMGKRPRTTTAKEMFHHITLNVVTIKAK
jgi:hypothetical protein